MRRKTIKLIHWPKKKKKKKKWKTKKTDTDKQISSHTNWKIQNRVLDSTIEIFTFKAYWKLSFQLGQCLVKNPIMFGLYISVILIEMP